MPNPAGSDAARTLLAGITLPAPPVVIPRQIGHDAAAAVPVEHLAALEKAAAGASVVAVQMADREARRALLADWVYRNAAQFPGGQLYFVSAIAFFPSLSGLSTLLFLILNSPNWPWVRRSSGSRDLVIAEFA
ncbi:hypothetical protein [Streptomyces prunicolor]|uniref:hypothetical protein n=1 Tax=Streptomyces prunicolor TaxID=67348 RepID=UPI00037172E6|nr:hypothetical protein [Streptomyces prunicolor]